MDLVKLSLVAAAAVFALSCSRTTTTQTANTSLSSNNNSVGAVATTAPLAPKGQVGNLDQRARLQAADSFDLVETETDETYAANCMICHKDTGKGGKVTIKGKSLNAADLTSDKMKKHTNEQLFKDISEGAPDEGMPAFQGKLSDDQITAVVAYIRKLQSK
jgi:mono/diheme cytochrome c family protein